LGLFFEEEKVTIDFENQHGTETYSGLVDKREPVLAALGLSYENQASLQLDFESETVVQMFANGAVEKTHLPDLSLKEDEILEILDFCQADLSNSIRIYEALFNGEIDANIAEILVRLDSQQNSADPMVKEYLDNLLEGK